MTAAVPPVGCVAFDDGGTLAEEDVAVDAADHRPIIATFVLGGE